LLKKNILKLIAALKRIPFSTSKKDRLDEIISTELERLDQ